MRCALLACLWVGCYRPSGLECAVSCANGASCPGGLTCGTTDQLCHSGPRECSEIDASVADDGAPGDAQGDASGDAPYVGACTSFLPTVVACYAFEGTAHDSSPSHLDAVANAVTFSPGLVGSALALDKNSSAVIGDTMLLDLEQFTVEAWLYQRAMTGGQNVTVVNNVLQYGLFIDTGNKPYCAYFTMAGLSVALAATALPVNEWTHLACTYDGTQLTLYVNGAVARENHDGGAVLKGGTSGTGIGSVVNDDPNSRYVGLVDELRISLVARTHAEICADAHRTACP